MRIAIKTTRAAGIVIFASRALDDARAFSVRPSDHRRHRATPSSSPDASSFAAGSLPPQPPRRTTTASSSSSSSSSDDAGEDPYAILGLDRSYPPEDFADVHRAYRDLARRYHPDVVVGPDATPEERDRANFDFARINGAYECLKGARDETTFDVVLMGGNFEVGKRDRRVRIKTSEDIRRSNPDRVNYDRILELRDGGRNLKGRNWSDPEEFEYVQGGRHNGDFGPPRRW
ncbi:hypothetical protein ACHAW5_010449 [Stephanodiscus triporus]|uniref:J domain-containing protein n=1 Tax=Stephanodiscus triporus TaxID=2934178 RepID=A0ABD3MJI1_9STRA